MRPDEEQGSHDYGRWCTMNEEFNDARLASIYDAVNPWGEDEDFYLSLPRNGNVSILDLGCGTGRLACAYASEGHDVLGADPAAAMLDTARAREWGDQVEWVHSNAQSFRSERRFDLIVMTGHAFQFLHTDQDIEAGLSTMKRHLAPGGRVVFETRNPLARVWSNWTAENLVTIAIESEDKVDVWATVDEVDGDYVRFKMNYLIERTQEKLVSNNTLRFLGRAALEAHLGRAGLQLEQLLGDWNSEPFSPSSPEMIVVASSVS